MTRLLEMLANDAPLACDWGVAAWVRTPVLLATVDAILMLREV